MGHLEVQFETMKPISDPTSSNQSSEAYRKIDLYSQKNGKKKLYLRILDPQSKVNTYNILAGYTTPYKRDELEDKILDNILVPAMFRCYATPDRNPAMATNPGKGWIYIIRTFKDCDGSDTTELWRELKSLGTGSYQDVNLIENLGTDENQILRKDTEHREATCQPAFRVLLPYKVNKDPQQLWIAYSEVQWSLARIQQMLDDVDLREKRMHSVDLSDADADFANSNCSWVRKKLQQFDSINIYDWQDTCGKPAKLYNLKTAPDTESKNLPESFKEDIPVIYLDNPVGIAKDLAAVYQSACKAMHEEVAVTYAQAGTNQIDRENPNMYDPSNWVKSAILLNKYIHTKLGPSPTAQVPARKQKLSELQADYGEQLKIRYQNQDKYSAVQKQEQDKIIHDLNKEICRLKQETDVNSRPFLDENNTYKSHKDHLQRVRDAIDPKRLERALYKEQRIPLREDILTTRKQLVNFLQHELATADDTPMLLALDDHFTLPTFYPTNMVVKEIANKLAAVDDPNAKPNTLKPERVWPNWKIDAWATMAGILGWLDKHEYTFDHEMEADYDAWKLRFEGEGCELLRKLHDPEFGYAVHKRLFPKAGSDPLSPADQGNDPAFYQLFQFVPAVDLTDQDKKLLIEETMAQMRNFLKQFIEIYAMKNNSTKGKQVNFPDYASSIKRIEQCQARIFTDITQIPLTEEVVDIHTYSTYIGSDSFAQFRKFFIMGGKYWDKALDNATEEAKKGIKVAVKTGSNKQAIADFEARINASEITKAAGTGLLTIIEIVNVKNSLQAFFDADEQNQDFYHLFDLIDSSLSLFGTVGDLKQTFATAAASVGRRHTVVAREGAAAIKGSLGYSIAGFASTAMDVCFALDHMFDNIRQGDDSYNAHMVIACGGFLSLLGAESAMAILVGAEAAAALAPLGLVGATLAFIGYALLATLFPEKNAIELWAINGPFGLVPFMGHEAGDDPRLRRSTDSSHRILTNRGKKRTLKETEKQYRYHVWCETAEEAYKAILDALYRPKVSIVPTQHNSEQRLMVKISAPWKPVKSYLTVECRQIERPWVKTKKGYRIVTARNKGSFQGLQKRKSLGITDSATDYFTDMQLEETDITTIYLENPIEFNQVDDVKYFNLGEYLDKDADKPNSYQINFFNHIHTELLVKVKLHVTGKTEFTIPYETIVYDDTGDTISTEEETSAKDSKPTTNDAADQQEQENKENHWLTAHFSGLNPYRGHAEDEEN